MFSPYHLLPIDKWRSKTLELIDEHPLNPQELLEIALKSWDDIFNSAIGTKPFQIGTDILPVPQIMGFLLHELIALELEYRYTNVWRKGATAYEKDVVYMPDTTYSIEIKTSSSGKNIYGNRSYSQKTQTPKKSKSGYYLAVNFEKFRASDHQPKIILVRFGWLDHDDWKGQASATGQQARLSSAVEQHKLIILPVQK